MMCKKSCFIKCLGGAGIQPRTSWLQGDPADHSTTWPRKAGHKNLNSRLKRFPPFLRLNEMKADGSDAAAIFCHRGYFFIFFSLALSVCLSRSLPLFLLKFSLLFLSLHISRSPLSLNPSPPSWLSFYMIIAL